MYYVRRGFPFLDDKLYQLTYELASKTKRKVFSNKKGGRLEVVTQIFAKEAKPAKEELSEYFCSKSNWSKPCADKKFLWTLSSMGTHTKIEFMPNNIWNIDESGVQDVPKSQKVIGVKGECAFQTIADNKSVTSTVVTYISAGGWWSPLWFCSRQPG